MWLGDRGGWLPARLPFGLPCDGHAHGILDADDVPREVKQARSGVFAGVAGSVPGGSTRVGSLQWARWKKQGQYARLCWIPRSPDVRIQSGALRHALARVRRASRHAISAV